VSRSTVHLGDPTSHDPVESDTLTSAPSQKYSLDPVTSSIELPSPVRGQEWRGDGTGPRATVDEGLGRVGD